MFSCHKKDETSIKINKYFSCLVRYSILIYFSFVFCACLLILLGVQHLFLVYLCVSYPHLSLIILALHLCFLTIFYFKISFLYFIIYQGCIFCTRFIFTPAAIFFIFLSLLVFFSSKEGGKMEKYFQSSLFYSYYPPSYIFF